MAFVQFELSY